MSSAVLEEALKKAALAWVSVGDRPALGLWCMALEGSLIMVTGPGEQFAPDLPSAQRATVRLRGDTGGLIVVAEMTVARILPGSDDWETAGPQLAAKRLNAHGSIDSVLTRWVETGCTVLRLAPIEDAPVTAPDLPAESSAAEPRETPARIEVRRPFRLHKVRRR